MACIATDTADDAGGEVALLRTVVLAVSNLTTVLTSLVFVVSERTVECGKFTKLIALQLILTFGDGRSLQIVRTSLQKCFEQAQTYRLDDIVDQLLRFVDLVFSIRHDQAVEVLVQIARVSGIRLALSFFDRAFASDGDLGTGLGFHLFECVTTRADEQADC